MNVVKGMSQIKGIMASDKRGAENAKAKVPPVSANSRPPNLPVPPQRQQQQQVRLDEERRTAGAKRQQNHYTT